MAERERIGIPTAAQSADNNAHPPAIVIYLVNPFLCSGSAEGLGEDEDAEEGEPSSMWLLALLRCYTETLSMLPESVRPALVLQVSILNSCVITSQKHTAKIMWTFKNNQAMILQDWVVYKIFV